MDNGDLTKSVQLESGGVLDRLPDEALIVLATDAEAVCRPRLYIHSKKGSSVVYVLRYWYRAGKRMKRRSVYLGPLTDLEVKHFELLLQIIHRDQEKMLCHQSLANLEECMKIAQRSLKEAKRYAKIYASHCGFRLKGRLIHRVLGAGDHSSLQDYPKLVEYQHNVDIRALHKFADSLSNVYDASVKVAHVALVLLLLLSRRAKERKEGAIPHSRLIRYERTLAGFIRDIDMIAEANMRIEKELKTLEQRRAA